jgi:hypothetical protein
MSWLAIPSILSVPDRNRRAEFSAFLGFDACIDNIVKVVREKNEIGKPVYFTDSSQLADYILKRAHK